MRLKQGDLRARVLRLEERARPESPITRYWDLYGFDYLLAVARGSGRDAIRKRMVEKQGQEATDFLIQRFDQELTASHGNRSRDGDDNRG